MLDTADFPKKIEEIGLGRRHDEGLQVGLTVQEMERLLIMKTLEAFHGNRTEAAAQLDISTRTLRNKLHEYGAMDAFKENDKSADINEERATAVSA